MFKLTKIRLVGAGFIAIPLTLLVALNAPSLFNQSHDKAISLLFEVQDSEGNSITPSCIPAVKSLMFGPRQGAQVRDVIVWFEDNEQPDNCGRKIRFRTRTFLGQPLELLERSHYCPKTISVAGSNEPFKIIEIDGDRKVDSASGNYAAPCSRAVEFKIIMALPAWDRQYIHFLAPRPFQKHNSERPIVPEVSAQPTEEVATHPIPALNGLRVTLIDTQISAMLAVLNIVLSILIGVGASALFEAWAHKHRQNS